MEGRYLPGRVENELWVWNDLFEDVKDAIPESTEGNIDGAVEDAMQSLRM